MAVRPREGAVTTVNYPNPVQVNGYSCKNCTDVDYAKKNIDPAHPSDGPFGVDSKAKPAVTFGGVLAGVSAASGTTAQPSSTQGLRLLDVTA
jgi:hypothetical protein